MSQSNVEVVRSVVEAFNARDRQRLVSMMDPAFEFHSAAEGRAERERYTPALGWLVHPKREPQRASQSSRSGLQTRPPTRVSC